MTKRILSMFLALSMMLSLVPVSAFADTGGGISFVPSKTAELEEQNDGTGSSSGTRISPDGSLAINNNGKPGFAAGSTTTPYWTYDSSSDTLKLMTSNTDDDNVVFDFTGQTIKVKNLVFDSGLRSSGLTIKGGTFASPDGGEINLTIEDSQYSDVIMDGVTFAGSVQWNVDDLATELFLYGGSNGVTIQGDLDLSAYKGSESLRLSLKNACITGTLKFPSPFYSVTFDPDAPSAVHAISPLGEESEGWLANNFIFNAKQLTTTNGSCKIEAAYANSQTAVFETANENSAWVSKGAAVTLTGESGGEGWEVLDADGSAVAYTESTDKTTVAFTMPSRAVTATQLFPLVINSNSLPTKTKGIGWSFTPGAPGTLTIEAGHTFNFDPNATAGSTTDATHHLVNYLDPTTPYTGCSVINYGTITHAYLRANESSKKGELTNYGTIQNSALYNLPILKTGTIQQCQFQYNTLNSDDDQKVPTEFAGISDSVFLVDDPKETLAALADLRLIRAATWSVDLLHYSYAYFTGNYEPEVDKRIDLRLYLYGLTNVNGESIETYRDYISLDTENLSNATYYLARLPEKDLVLNVPIPLKIDPSTHLPVLEGTFIGSDGNRTGDGWSYDENNATLFLKEGTFDFSDQPAVGCKVQVYKNVTIAGGTFAEQVSGYVDKDSGTTARYTVSRGVFRLQPSNIDNANDCLPIILQSGTNTLNGIDWPSDSTGKRLAYAYGSDNAIELVNTGNSNWGSNSFWTPFDVGGDSPEELTEAQKEAISWKDDNGKITMTVGYNKDIGGTILKKLSIYISTYSTELVITDSGIPVLYHVKHTGSLYEGDGWTYDSDQDILTITKALSPKFFSTPFFWSACISSQVVYDGGSLADYVVLTKQPTGAGSDAYHSIAFGDGKTTFRYYSMDPDSNSKPITSNPITTLWVQKSSQTLTLQLDETTNVLNINGKPISSYDAFTETSGNNKLFSFRSGTGGEDLVLNQTMDLAIDETGFPAGTDGGKISVYGMSSGGMLWHFNASTQTLVLESGEFDLSAQNAVACAVEAAAGTFITGGTFTKEVASEGTITGGTFTEKVTSEGTITGGTFTEKVTVTGNGTITGGTFTQKPETTGQQPQLVEVTLTGGAGFEGLGDAATAYMAPGTAVQLTYTDTAHTFYGWAAQQEGEAATYQKMALTAKYTLPSGQQNAVTLSPIVEMGKADLTVSSSASAPYALADFAAMLGVPLTGLRYYALDESGNRVEPALADSPTADGLYAVYVLPEAAEPPFAEQNGVYYYLPSEVDTGVTFRIGSEPEGPDTPDEPGMPDAPDGGDDGSTGLAVVLGTAAVGGAAYLIGTQVWMETNLPDGVIPTNRQQLADMLWTAAGKPEPASAALYADISAEAVESQKAARWCVEQGLVKDHGESFDPDTYTFRPQVIKAWNDLQARKAQ